MKYINGADSLPEDLLNEIRKYAEGVYVYIPKSALKKDKWGEHTNHRHEMELRNRHIYDKYLEGRNVAAISECFHLSAKSVRRIILLQKRKMEPAAIMIKEILEEWNLDYTPVQSCHSTWNIHEAYILKEYSNLNALKRNIAMIKILHKEGIPVQELIQLPDGKDYLERDGKMYILTTRLKGNNIVNLNLCEEEWFFEFGAILAGLHLVFKKIESNFSIVQKNMLEEMNGWVFRNLLQFNPSYLRQEDIKKSIYELEQVYDGLPKQLIHRDVHLGNFLFNNMVFSGYIDFDLSQINVRIFDLCYFLLGILMKEDSNRVGKERWYRIVRRVIEGYSSRNPLSQIEKESVVCMMKNIELLFTAYFLGIGDEKLAEDSAGLFQFVTKWEEKIRDAVLI